MRPAWFSLFCALLSPSFRPRLGRNVMPVSWAQIPIISAQQSVLPWAIHAQRKSFSTPRSQSNPLSTHGSQLTRRNGGPCPVGSDPGPTGPADSIEDLELYEEKGMSLEDRGHTASSHVCRWHPSRNPNTWRRFTESEGASQRMSGHLSRPWYELLEAAERPRVEAFRMAGHQQVSSQELLDLANLWVARRTSNLVRMMYSNVELQVRPIWVALHQNQDEVADMYAPFLPVVDSEYGQVLLSNTEPVATVRGGTFTGCDVAFGSWKNYFIGLAGDLGAAPEYSLWPNQVFCNDRVAFNLQTFAHLAEFLADATEERIQYHLGNLRNLQVDRGYREQWCWYALRKRWGEQALKKHGIDV